MTQHKIGYLLSCRICRAEVSLDLDPARRMAEVGTFCAAHNTHDEGLGVQLIIPLARQGDHH
jgi:hypothetical protein